VSPNIIRLAKTRGLQWTTYVAPMWERRHTYKILVKKPVRKVKKGRG